MNPPAIGSWIAQAVAKQEPRRSTGIRMRKGFSHGGGGGMGNLVATTRKKQPKDTMASDPTQAEGPQSILGPAYFQDRSQQLDRKKKKKPTPYAPAGADAVGKWLAPSVSTSPAEFEAMNFFEPYQPQ